MPARCPEEDPNCTEIRTVRLHIVDRQQIWLHIDDVEWAIRYLFAQNQFKKGIPLVTDDDEGHGIPLLGIEDKGADGTPLEDSGGAAEFRGDGCFCEARGDVGF